MIEPIFRVVPLWTIFIFTLLLIISGTLLGIRLSKRNINEEEITQKHGQNSLLVGAMLGLLSFMLAFTFGTTANRFDIRKGVLLDEVNSLGTAYLRADLLPDSHRVLNKDYLSEYVELLVEATQEKAPLPLIIEKLDRLEKELWQKNIELVQTDFAPQLLTFYLESLNDVFDLLTKRVTVSLRYHIPTTIWIMLFTIIWLTMMAVGYVAGLSKGISPFLGVILALTFSSIIYLIADLDSINKGFLKVSQQPIIELQQRFQQP
jgi:hypothetical protein